MPASSELSAAYVGTRPVTAMYRGTRPIAFGSGASIPEGSAAASHGSYGNRSTFENGLGGIGGRVEGQSFLLLTMAFGNFTNATPTGWSLPFDHWSPEVIGYGSSTYEMWAAAKVIVGADQSNTGASWEFSGVNSTWKIQSYAIKWSDTQHEGIQVLYDGQSDFSGKFSGTEPTSFDVTGDTVTPGDQDMPAYATSLFGIMANDNGSTPGFAEGYSFAGRNSSTGTDSQEGYVWRVSGNPNNRVPWTWLQYAETYRICTPRIVIPGAPIE